MKESLQTFFIFLEKLQKILRILTFELVTAPVTAKSLFTINYCLIVSIYRAIIKVLLRSKIIFIFSSDFETLFTKQSPCETLGLNFENKTVYSNYNFPIF